MEATPPEANHKATRRPNVSFPPLAFAASSPVILRTTSKLADGRNFEKYMRRLD